MSLGDTLSSELTDEYGMGAERAGKGRMARGLVAERRHPTSLAWVGADKFGPAVRAKAWIWKGWVLGRWWRSRGAVGRLAGARVLLWESWGEAVTEWVAHLIE
jgi:hypothetical protein